jgi:integrase
MFRHSCASRAARKGLSAFEIKERLGHVSVLSSEVYVHLFGPEKAKAIIIIETRGHYEQAKEAL